jgi:hypothetical protein
MTVKTTEGTARGITDNRSGTKGLTVMGQSFFLSEGIN